MIIQLEGASAENTEAARDSLAAMTRDWGQDVTEVPAGLIGPAAAAGTSAAHRTRGIDPVALTALIVSIPSAATAVLDLADRIGKRRRARELIDHAQQLADRQQVIARVVSQTRTVELRTMTPDQLLDLLADEDSPGE